MKFPLMVIGLFTALIFFFRWYNQRPKEEKIKEPEKEEKKSGGGSKVFVFAGFILVSVSAAFFAYSLIGAMFPAAKPATASAVAQNWQLCWEKNPAATMDTPTIQKCMPAVVKNDGNSLLVFYHYGNSKTGTLEGISTSAGIYDGGWKDGEGWGKFHLRVVSSNSAVGWVDDKGNKPINLWLVAS